jgi:hypothetical protein
LLVELESDFGFEDPLSVFVDDGDELSLLVDELPDDELSDDELSDDELSDDELSDDEPPSADFVVVDEVERLSFL